MKLDMARLRGLSSFPLLLLTLCAATATLGCNAQARATASDGTESIEAALALPMEELIALDASIELSSQQQAIREEALTAIPAPCCSDRTAHTCCCQCNLARSWWGLTKLLITEHDQDVAGVKKHVEAWIANLRPEGFEGNSCYTGRCFVAAKNDGCSGMNPGHVVTD